MPYRRRSRIPLLAIAVLLIVSVIPATPASAIGAWTPNTTPVLTGNWASPAYNDPHVIRISSTSYLMFMSQSYAGRTDGVAIHRATSSDGVTWSVETTPVLIPGSNTTDWDYNKVETPTLVYHTNKWHMYYCGISAATGVYQIGHATSTDLYAWTKDTANPVIPLSSVSTAVHVCEPTALVRNSRINVFFTGVLPRSGNPQPPVPTSEFTIYRTIATNKMTGTSFGTSAAVYSQANNSRYPSSSGYAGFSTPHAALDTDGSIHLFHDVYHWTNEPSDPWGGYRQVAIEHAVSTDGGATFTPDATAIFDRTDFSWTSREIRSPMALKDGTTWKMWFAGDDVETTTWTGAMSIGYATAPA